MMFGRRNLALEFDMFRAYVVSVIRSLILADCNSLAARKARTAYRFALVALFLSAFSVAFSLVVLLAQ